MRLPYLVLFTVSTMSHGNSAAVVTLTIGPRFAFDWRVCAYALRVALCHSLYHGTYRNRAVRVAEFNTKDDVISKSKLQDAACVLESLQHPSVATLLGMMYTFYSNNYWLFIVLLDVVHCFGCSRSQWELCVAFTWKMQTISSFVGCYVMLGV